MAHQANITVIGQDGDEMKFTGVVSDADAALFDQYLANVDRLLAVPLARDGIPFTYTLAISNGQMETKEYDLPPFHEVAALLHCMRVIILTGEPASYDRVTGTLSKIFEHQYIRSLIKSQRRLYDGRSDQDLVRVTSNDVLLNSEAVLQDWLYAYEYHQDPSRRERIESLHRLVPLEHSIPIFLGLLAGKLQAITQVAALVAVILGRQASLEVQRRG